VMMRVVRGQCHPSAGHRRDDPLQALCLASAPLGAHGL
jgi:hypothetical protein